MSDKQEQIILATLKAYSRKPFGPVVLDEIAGLAGLAKGTLYLYFQNKEDLVYRTILFVLDQVELAVREAVSRVEAPLEVLERVALSYLETFYENADYLAFFFVLSDPGLVMDRAILFNALEERKRRFLDFLADTLRRGQEQGVVREDLDAREIAVLFEGMLTGIIHRMGRAISGEHFHIWRSVQTLMKVLAEGLNPRNCRER